MAQSRLPRGEAALRSAAGTITYEFNMFRRACHELGQIRPPNVFRDNMLVEIVLVHARNLRDFFAKTGKTDDILARDFVKQMPRIAMPILRSASVRKRVNRLLSHPSYSRPRLKKAWDFHAICKEVSAGWDSFMKRLARDRPERTKWFV